MKIEVGEFNPKEMRKAFIDALYENFPEAGVDKALKKGASDDYKSFKEVCRRFNTFFHNHEYSGRYTENAVVDSTTCCGVHELSFMDYSVTGKADTNTKKILLALTGGFADTYINYFYLKYYDSGEKVNLDNDHDDGRWNHNDDEEHFVYNLSGPEVFAELQKLGWKCTGRFINSNHDWPNYEMSANYGEDTRG